MVCKEEVLLWFKDLDSFKRIDVLYELLNMCLPFEIRFIGSCIEELGKHTYQELRGPSLAANDLDKLSKDVSFNQGIMDEGVRHRLLIYMSLLSSRNYSVASWMYRKLLRTEAMDEYLVKEKGKDEVLHSEFLLLFTMALHHPAFTFEHKQFFSRILNGLIDIRENRISAKHSALGYPPGFGYPTMKGQEAPSVPVKTSVTSCGDSAASTVAFHQPPGLPHLPPPPHIDFAAVPMWSRPGFPYGAPEVPPFPTSTMSPLVSQAASPSQSRSTSPHRTSMGRPPPSSPQSALQPSTIVPPPHTGGGQLPPGTGPPPPLINGLPPVEVLPSVVSPQLEQLSQSSLPPPPVAAAFSIAGAVLPPPPVMQSDMKVTDEDQAKSSLEEKHLREILWPQQGIINPEVKPNGLCFSPFIGKVRPYLVDQIHMMSLDGENSLHQSNSSGNSSPNETPPGTPCSTPAATPHGPGRGEGKSRANGMPFGTNSVHPIADTTSPPPAFSNSSVPYSFPQLYATLPPNRSMFHYSQTYRPTFTAQYPSFPAESNFTYTFPYVPLMYSSPFPARTQQGCYNCGAPSHVGSECTSQNIEDITQKRAFSLEFTSPLPDSEK